MRSITPLLTIAFGSFLLVACHGFLLQSSDQPFTKLKASAGKEPAEINNNKNHEDEKQLTLYQILGASPDDTKEELKREYIQLAKQTHPDAQKDATGETIDLEFSDIAAAYKVLSNPKERRRYDRKMRAEALSRELSEWSSDIAERAAPQVRDLLDNMAMPFLRRTTATTLATVQAAARQMRKEEIQKQKRISGEAINNNNNETADIGSVFTSAMKAAQKAGNLVDNMELLEKSEGLELQVLQHIEQANQIKSELDNTTMRRAITALRTPNASFSAADANEVLSFWNGTSITFLERAKLKNPLDKKIQELEVAEEGMLEKEMELGAAIKLYQTAERKLQKARADRVLALQAEKRAREALARAKRKVAESRTKVNDTTKNLSQAEMAYEKVAQERERMAQALIKQQEAVRKAVSGRKEVSNALQEEKVDGEPTLTDLENLEKEEAKLLEEYSRLEVTASKLQAKANELREKAEKLKDQQ